MNKNLIFLFSTLSIVLLASFAMNKSEDKTNKPFSVDPIIADFFSPNGDGHNDFFIIKNIQEFPINKLFIFNRWGESVYTSEPYNNDWDGTLGKENPLFGDTVPEGLYFYRFEFYSGDFPDQASGKIILKR